MHDIDDDRRKALCFIHNVNSVDGYISRFTSLVDNTVLVEVSANLPRFIVCGLLVTTSLSRVEHEGKARLLAPAR